MNGFAWDHNAYYHRLLLRQVPDRCTRALDVGCGAGAFAARLSRRVGQVDAIDRSPAMIAAASRRSPGAVTWALGDIMRDEYPAATYDAIVSVSALHHVPLQGALRRLAKALRPGGVLAAVGIPRPDLVRELPVELLAVASQPLLAAAFAAARAAGPGTWYAKEPTESVMPVVWPPALTTRKVRRQARAVLAGVRVRRLVFWRYLLVWQKPPAAP